jgi:4-hydroxybenzoate polyprenyltransferase
MTGTARPGLRAWLDLARAGNLPSVWSNVLAALVLSTPAAADGATSHLWPPAAIWVGATLVGSLAYAGGAMLNDVFDAAFDRRHRPDRAIPSGAVSRAAAAWVGGLMLAASVVLFGGALGASWLWATVMAGAIVSYDWLHKRWAGSVLLMAACRAGLGVTVASLPGHAFTPALLVWAGVLAVYIVGLSLIARAEYRPGAPAAVLGRWVGRLLAGMPLVDAAAVLAVGAWPAAIACAAAVPAGRGAQRLFAST